MCPKQAVNKANMLTCFRQRLPPRSGKRRLALSTERCAFKSTRPPPSLSRTQTTEPALRRARLPEASEVRRGGGPRSLLRRAQVRRHGRSRFPTLDGRRRRRRQAVQQQSCQAPPQRAPIFRPRLRGGRCRRCCQASGIARGSNARVQPRCCWRWWWWRKGTLAEEGTPCSQAGAHAGARRGAQGECFSPRCIYCKPTITSPVCCFWGVSTPPPRKPSICVDVGCAWFGRRAVGEGYTASFSHARLFTGVFFTRCLPCLRPPLIHHAVHHSHHPLCPSSMLTISGIFCFTPCSLAPLRSLAVFHSYHRFVPPSVQLFTTKHGSAQPLRAGSTFAPSVCSRPQPARMPRT